jgi:hypothetical protein
MVIGHGFAWSHLPKTGGTATLAMFRLFPDLVEFADERDSDTQHAKFADRAEAVAGKLLVLNLRRLPAWVLSRAQQVARFGVWPDFRPQPMPPPDRLAESTLPDRRLAAFTAGVRIDRWLRMEHLATDMVSLLAELRDVTAAEARAVQSLAPVNANDYEHSLEHWFSAEQIQRMYQQNPAWACRELALYGEVDTAKHGVVATTQGEATSRTTARS